MMNIKLIAFLFTIVLISNGCYKDSIDFTADEIPPVMATGSIGEFYDRLPDNFDSLSFDAGEDIFIVTENNTVIAIQGGIFADEASNLLKRFFIEKRNLN